jgi:hypothetical protein
MAVNWKLWEDRLTVELWEAICLSQDLEPVRPSTYNYLHSRESPTFRGPTAAAEEEFKRRLEFARDHLLTGRLPVVALGENAWTARVGLISFRRWVESLKTPWTLPAEFPPVLSDSTSLKSESVPERNLRWARIEEKEKKANPSTSATQIARSVAEAEGLPFDRVKRGIQTGRKILAGLSGKGKTSKLSAKPAGLWPSVSPGKNRR